MTWVVTAVLFCLVRVFFSEASAKVRRFFHSAKLFREKFRFLLKIFMLFDVGQREKRGLHYYIFVRVWIIRRVECLCRSGYELYIMGVDNP